MKKMAVLTKRRPMPMGIMISGSVILLYPVQTMKAPTAIRPMRTNEHSMAVWKKESRPGKKCAGLSTNIRRPPFWGVPFRR
jgi:hypothetical protein